MDTVFWKGDFSLHGPRVAKICESSVPAVLDLLLDLIVEVDGNYIENKKKI